MDGQSQPTHLTSSRVADAKSGLFSAIDEELTRQVAEARSDVATSLLAQIEVLREQLRDVQDQVAAGARKLEETERRANAGEVAARLATETADKERAASQAELQRVGEAAALVSSELLATSEAAEKTRAENAELTDTLQREQERRERTEQELTLAREQLQQAQETLLDTVAHGALERDALSVAARSREEALFARLVDVQTQTQAALDAARLPS